MSNVPMTRPEQMLAFHDGQFPGNSFAGLEGGRILFSNGTHFSVSADGGVTWSEPYEGLDENGDPLTLKELFTRATLRRRDRHGDEAYQTRHLAPIRVADGLQALGR